MAESIGWLEKPDEWQHVANTYIPTVHAYNEIYGYLNDNLQFSGKQVLDVGCGEGRYLRVAANRGATVTAFDINFEDVKRTSRFTKTYAFVASASEVALPNKTFDQAFCFMVLMLLPDSDVCKALLNLR